MAILNTIRTARKEHSCATGSHVCHREIQPGQRYRRSVATPNDPEINNTNWWSLAECTACAALYGRPIEVAS